MSTVVNSERIPNNVNLSDDKKLQRALEAWQPSFINWWKEMGPVGFQGDDVFLRTAISVEPDPPNVPDRRCTQVPFRVAWRSACHAGKDRDMPFKARARTTVRKKTAAAGPTTSNQLDAIAGMETS